GVAGAAVAPVFIPALFGGRFADAVVPAMLLCIAAIPFSFSLLLHDFVRGLGYPGIGLRPELMGVAVSAALLFMLLPRYGGVGAAFSSLASYCAVTVALLRSTVRTIPE